MAVKKEKSVNVPLDIHFEQMIISAERYACGRRTYIVSDTVNYILSLLPLLSDWCLGVMMTDMYTNLEYEATLSGKDGLSVFGDACDKREWMKFIEKCREEINKRESESNINN